MNDHKGYSGVGTGIEQTGESWKLFLSDKAQHNEREQLGVVCAYPGAQRQQVHTDNPPLYPEAGGFNALCPPYALRGGAVGRP